MSRYTTTETACSRGLPQHRTPALMFPRHTSMMATFRPTVKVAEALGYPLSPPIPPTVADHTRQASGQ